jgi:uncharacterized membrane protein YhaH (DUF805 family)
VVTAAQFALQRSALDGPPSQREQIMDAKGIIKRLPWWVTWVAIPVVVVVVFGSLIATVVGFVIHLLFKVLILAAVVGGLIYLVRRFTSASSSHYDKW